MTRSRRAENTGFVCAHCSADVPANTDGHYRNHCPFCLWSLHVDITPGDRLQSCGGSMEPIAVWVKRDGDDVLFSTLAGRRKSLNWSRDPRAALLVYDERDPGRYVEVRGRVTLVDDPGGSLIKELSHKYDGQDFTGVVEGRVIVRLTPERVVTR